jgi:uncharacterized damage-inducible protein DinB
MTDDKNLLDELLEAWRYTREGVIAEAENLPRHRFLENPPGLLRSPLDLVNHIVESGWLMAGELTHPKGDFQRKGSDALTAEHTPPGDYSRDVDGALAALRRSHEQGEAKIRAAGLDAMMKPIRQFNGVPARRISWMHHGVSHEEYHRGQLALYARLFGVVPALTKAIHGSGS